MEELPTDAFYDLTRPGQVAVSPDGDRVAFTVTEADPDEDELPASVFVAPADGSRDRHRLTRVSSAGNVTWSPDGTRLGVVMARETDVDLRVGRDDEEADGDTEGADADGTDAEGGDDEDVDGTGDDDADDGEGGNGPPDDEPKPQVWVYDLERGGDARQVTDREYGVRDFDWGPDGERVVVAARDPTDDEADYLEQRREGGPVETERLQHKFDGQGWLDTVRTYLFVVDVETRDIERLDDAYGRGIMEAGAGLQPAWHPTDGTVAFLSYRGDDPDDTYVQDVYLVDVGTGDLERVTAGEYAAMGPTWSPGGERLAFAARDPENWYTPTEVCVAERAADGPSARGGSEDSDWTYDTVTGDLDRTVGFFGAPAWLDDGTLLAGIGDEGWTRFVELDATGGHDRVFDHQRRDETHLGFDVGGSGTAAAGDATVAAVRSHPNEGADVVAMDAADLAAGPDDDDPRRRLTDFNPGLLGEYDHPEMARRTFESADGTEIEGLAYYPPDFDPDDPDLRPTLLWIHGGPMAYDQPRFDFNTSFWTTRGYVVYNVNYRGSTSYGRAFCESLRGAWNTVEVADLLAGVADLVECGWADPDRLFVGGFSQGGVNTGYLLTETDRFAAGAAEHGVYDMRSAFGTDDSHAWLEQDFGLPWENPEAYDAASSITDVDAIETPVLLTAGENDWRCPPTQSEQLYSALRKRGVPSKLVVYPDEHHNVSTPDRAVHRLETVDDWFARFDPEREGDEDGTADEDESEDASESAN